MRRAYALLLAAIAALSAPSLLAQTRGPSPIQVASEEERQRELSALGLKDTRPGAKNGDPASPFATNYG